MCTRKILVVDDESLILDMLDDAFSRVGYSVYLASTANEALGILKQESIPLMLINIGLGAMSGFELCKNIRKNNPKAIIYALTGYTGFFEPRTYLEAGFDGVFGKPISLKDLYQAAKESFEKLGSQC
jgi:DNA-binding response OmpR family regulator